MYHKTNHSIFIIFLFDLIFDKLFTSFSKFFFFFFSSFVNLKIKLSNFLNLTFKMIKSLSSFKKSSFEEINFISIISESDICLNNI
jgi:hypothetical protein